MSDEVRLGAIQRMHSQRSMIDLFQTHIPELKPALKTALLTPVKGLYVPLWSEKH